ncbi:HTH-type transcriptional regulator BetI [Saliniradius amylolyticus]|uniref:HTH-type transcriptional regulator BetI n=1 Tax=Saliniradius amylolyticus TaxID=2183582 RepID=A0A2S2E3W8_9ALTE|nr:transcriptional regulator BetI [Saliniradius amylolyticus]AWL12212.1 HTH-type transcriptional regulator BetI [Saliniradius amylolyticus]
MPKVGMEPVRRKQLILATLESVAEVGLQHTTINTISKKAGLSSGIISHYFGGKKELILATVRYLLTELHNNLVKHIADEPVDAKTRLYRIVETNFASVQREDRATKTWLSFWAESMHDPALHRLQRVNSKRLESNLKYAFKQMMSRDNAQQAASTTAAIIDGFWLRAALLGGDELFDQAERRTKTHIDTLIQAYGV